MWRGLSMVEGARNTLAHNISGGTAVQAVTVLERPADDE
jgi:hypothetical protein